MGQEARTKAGVNGLSGSLPCSDHPPRSQSKPFRSVAAHEGWSGFAPKLQTVTNDKKKGRGCYTPTPFSPTSPANLSLLGALAKGRRVVRLDLLAGFL
jgi:hypothetical protein